MHVRYKGEMYTDGTVVPTNKPIQMYSWLHRSDITKPKDINHINRYKGEKPLVQSYQPFYLSTSKTKPKGNTSCESCSPVIFVV